MNALQEERRRKNTGRIAMGRSGVRDCERYVAILTSRLDEALKAKDSESYAKFTQITNLLLLHLKDTYAQLDSAHHRLESALRKLQEFKGEPATM